MYKLKYGLKKYKKNKHKLLQGRGGGSPKSNKTEDWFKIIEIYHILLVLYSEWMFQRTVSTYPTDPPNITHQQQ